MTPDPLPPWLATSLDEFVSLVAASLLGLFISASYVLVGDRRETAPRLAAALTMLAIIMCLIVQVVDDLAGAFIVVGALTLLRLRAAIGDTREFSFLLLAVAAGMGAGEERYLVTVFGCLVAIAVAFLILPRIEEATLCDHRLRFSLPSTGVAEVRACFQERGLGPDLTIADVSDGRVEIRARFAGAPADMHDLVGALRGLSGAGEFETQSRMRGNAW